MPTQYRSRLVVFTNRSRGLHALNQCSIGSVEVRFFIGDPKNSLLNSINNLWCKNSEFYLCHCDSYCSVLSPALVVTDNDIHIHNA